MMCKDAGSTWLLANQRLLLALILASLRQEETQSISLFGCAVFWLLSNVAWLPRDLVELANQVTTAIPNCIAEVSLLLVCHGLGQ